MVRDQVAAVARRGEREFADFFAASWPRIGRTDHPEAYVRRMVVNEPLTS